MSQCNVLCILLNEMQGMRHDYGDELKSDRHFIPRDHFSCHNQTHRIITQTVNHKHPSLAADRIPVCVQIKV